jgi:hypothetical protein
MDRNASNRNGGSNRDNTAIIIMWKMKKDAGIGYSGWDIMRMNIDGLCMECLCKPPGPIYETAF